MRWGVLTAVLLIVGTARAQTANTTCDLTQTTNVVETWAATCRIMWDGKVLYDAPLPLPVPASYKEASRAVERFLKTTQFEVLRKMGLRRR